MDASSKWEARFVAEARSRTAREWMLRRRLVVFLGILTGSGLIGFIAAVLREHGWPPDTNLITPVLLGLAVIVYCYSSFQHFGLLQGAVEHTQRKG
jgi:O-antigen/teichoic acid export membrane protein